MLADSPVGRQTVPVLELRRKMDKDGDREVSVTLGSECCCLGEHKGMKPGRYTN